MKIKEYFDNKKKEKLPLIARVDLLKLQQQREQDVQDREISILAAADYTKKIPTIRLCYVALERFADGTKVGQTYGVSSPFRLPLGMTVEDACKVISYLSDGVEREHNLEPACERSVIMVSHILNAYGFEKVEGRERGHYHAVSEYQPFRKITAGFSACDEIHGTVDLFTVGGDFKVFKKSNLHNRYFDWYSSGVTQQDIKNIYKNIGQEYLLNGPIHVN